MGHEYKQVERQLYILEDTLMWTKQQANERLRAVIPPAIASLMRRGQYQNQIFS